MKRVLVVLLLLLAAVGMGYSVSGKVFARILVMDNPIGMGWSPQYWGASHNVDLWQGKDGTGFDVNFDNFGILYKTRVAASANVGSWLGTGLSKLSVSEDNNVALFGGQMPAASAGEVKATSPGYFQIHDLKVGDFVAAVGASWWTYLLNRTTTITTTNTLNDGLFMNEVYSMDFNKFYVDWRLSVPIIPGLLVMKQHDWDLGFVEMEFGNATGGTTTTNYAATNAVAFNNRHFLGYVYAPFHFMLTLEDMNVEVTALLSYKNVSDEVMYSNRSYESRIRPGVYGRTDIPISDLLGVHLMAGFYYENDYVYNAVTTNNGGDYGVTNTEALFDSMIVPLYAALNVRFGPGINMKLGYGVNLLLAANSKSYSANRTTTNSDVTVSGFYARNGYLGFAPDDSEDAIFQGFGDNLMDAAFLKFGGTGKFAQNWELRIEGAVSMNDQWNGDFGVQQKAYGTGYYTYTDNLSGTKTYKAQNELIHFYNWMSYDNQMYIKYEDSTVAIKFEFGGKPLNKIVTPAPIMGLFSALQMTYKF